jgi:hypothetical protein
MLSFVEITAMSDQNMECPHCGHLIEKKSTIQNAEKIVEEIKRITKREMRRNYFIETMSESSDSEREIVEKQRPSPSIKKKQFLEDNPLMEGAYMSSSEEEAINFRISYDMTGPAQTFKRSPANRYLPSAQH